MLLRFGAVSAKLIHHHFREAVKITQTLAQMGRALSFMPTEERISFNFHPSKIYVYLIWEEMTRRFSSMNKRITGLALVLVLLFAFSAWAAPTLRINTSRIPDVKKGETIDFELDYVAEDFEDDAVTWSVSPADAQEGISFNTDDVKFTGTPTKLGNFRFTVTATGKYPVPGSSKTTDDGAVSIDRTITVTKAYTIAVLPWGPSDFEAVSEDLDDVLAVTGLLKDSETAPDLSAIEFNTKATTPLTAWAVRGLPPGITAKIDGNEEATDGSSDVKITLTGTPTKAGIYNSIFVTASNKGGSVSSGPYTLRVFEKAAVTTKKLPDMTWGKPYSATVTATGGLTGYKVSWDAATTDLEAAGLSGISFDAETGKLFGTTASTDKANDTLKFETNKTKEVTLKFKAKSPHGEDGDSDEAEFTLKVLAVAPKILSKDEKQGDFDGLGLSLTSEDGTITTTKDGDLELKYTFDGPGTVTWTTSTLPTGFTSAETDGVLTITIAKDTVAQTLKKYPLTVTAKNAVGSDTSTIYLNLDAPDVAITATRAGILSAKMSDDNVTILSGSLFVVGDSVDATDRTPATGSALPRGVVRTKALKAKKAPSNRGEGESTGKLELTAFPGPIAWSVSNLPKGIKLSIDKSVSFDTKAYLVGSLTGETKKNHTFTVTATNKVYKMSDTIQGMITVYGKPTIKTKTLPPLTLGKAYSARIDYSGLDASIDVSFAASTDAPATGSALPARRGDYGASSEFSANNGVAKLTFDPKTRMITGSLDRFPATPKIPTSVDKKNPYTAKVIVTVKATNPGYGLGTDTIKDAASQDIVIMVKGVAPKFMTKKLIDFAAFGDNVDADGSKHTIYITGSKPMSFRAYIAGTDAEKFGLGSSDIPITVAEKTALPAAKKDDAAAAPVFTITKEYPDVNTTKLNVAYAEGQNFSLTGLPITISADNGASAPVINIFKVNITGYTPVIVSSDGTTEISKDITVNVAAGSEMPELVLKASGDLPLEFQYSGAKNGIEVEEGTDDTTKKPTLTIKGTPKDGKETKTTISVTLVNPVTKKKYTRKVIITGMLKPTITSKGKALIKEVDIGKAVSFKLAAKGSKPITWSVDKPAEIVALGLSLDEKTGVIKGTARNVTSKDGVEYGTLSFKFIASNDAGTNEVDAELGVKGKKPKLATKTIEIERTYDDSGKIVASGDTIMKTDILPTDMTANVQWSQAAGSSLPARLSGITIGNSSTRSYGSFDLSGFTGGATKGATVRVTADNFGNAVTGNVKVVVKDPAPSFDVSEEEEVKLKSNKTSGQSKNVSFTMKNDVVTGDSNITWKITGRPATPVTAVLGASSKAGATVKVTVAKGVSSKDVPASRREEWSNHFKTSFAISATNTLTKAVTIMRVSVDVTPHDVSALPAEKDALPENEELSENEATEETLSADELPAGEGTVTYGEARGESTLTEAERKAISDSGYIIAAILPEITADESGQYDLDAVSLDTAAPEGYELVWFAFPRNVESSDDDAIAEFYDEAGAEVFAVPEARKVVPSPWLEKEVIYAPVIAVKAPSTTDAKTSFDQAQEGDTVTVQAIEEATQNSAQESAETSAEAEKVSEEAKHEEAAE